MKQILFTLLLLASYQSFGQSKKPDYSLLWEITGNDLVGKSYVFGSMHLNDKRAFSFSDSLYNAFISCESFATEIQVDSMMVVMMNEMSDVFLAQNNDDPNSDDSKSLEKEFSSFDINGKPTFLDAYLFKAALAHNMQTYGLENMIQHMESYFDSGFDDENIEVGSPIYETAVRLYETGSIEKMEGEYSYEMEINDIIERNIIQANSIINISKNETVFAVVGAAHLFGEKNVLDVLKEKGYSVRKVGFGQSSSSMDELYMKSYENIPFTAELERLDMGFIIKSPQIAKAIKINPTAEMTISFDLGHGAVRGDILVPLPNLEQKESFRPAVEGFVQDPEKLVLINKSDDPQNYWEEYKSLEEDKTMGFKISQKGRVMMVQLLFTFAQSAYENMPADKRFHEIEMVEKEIVLNVQNDLKRYGVSYLFPADLDLITTRGYYNNDSTTGRIYNVYKSYSNVALGNEFLMKFQQLPGKFIFNNDYTALHVSSNNIIKRFSAKELDSKYSMKDGILRYSSVLENESMKIFLVTLIKGNVIVFLMQFDKNNNGRNAEFFDNFTFEDSISTELVNHNIDELGLQIGLGKEIMKDDNNIYSIDSLRLNTFNVFSDKMKPYSIESYEKDSIQSIRKKYVEYSDSLLSFDPIIVQDHLIGHHAIYSLDSSSLVRGEAELTYGDNKVRIIQYLSSENSIDQAKQMISSIKIDKEVKLFSSSPDNGKALLIDLKSMDEEVFERAKSNIIYTEFDSTHTALFIDVMTSTLLDEDSTYSAKYNLIDPFHSAKLDVKEVQLIYNSLAHIEEKERLLESMVLKNEPIFPKFALSQVITDPDKYTIPDYAMMNFEDSTLFFSTKDQLKYLVDSDMNKEVLLNAFLQNYEGLKQEKTYAEDSTWLAFHMASSIETFIQEDKDSDTIYVNQLMLNYIEKSPLGPLTQELLRALRISKTLYNRYIYASHVIVNGGQITTQEMRNIIDDEYYFEYLLGDCQRNHRMEIFPEEFIDEEKTAIISARNYFTYSLYETCESCEIYGEQTIRFNEGDQKMLYVKCFNIDEKHLLGIVGPFKDGVLDIVNENSAFYDQSYEIKDEKKVKQILIDFYTK